MGQPTSSRAEMYGKCSVVVECPVCRTSFRRNRAHVARQTFSACSRACQVLRRGRAWLPRFLAFTTLRDNGCIEWTGSVQNAGYGTLRVDGKSRLAHRHAWILANGSIPAGMCVCHACDNPKCVNADHLFLGTVSDNHADMVRKGRARGGSPEARGEKNNAAKLTEADVREIRRLVAGGAPRKAIASAHNVTTGAVDDVISGRTWSHVSA